MVVRIDETGHHDCARSVDHLRVGFQVGLDGNDLRALDEHVGIRKIADVAIHCEDCPALEQNAIASTAPDHSLSLCRYGPGYGLHGGRNKSRRTRFHYVPARRIRDRAAWCVHGISPFLLVWLYWSRKSADWKIYTLS